MLGKKKRAGVAAVMAAGLLAASPAAWAYSYVAARTTHYVGRHVSIGAKWVGSYRLKNTTRGGNAQFYCADPDRDGPSAGGTYRSQGATSGWAREGGGRLSATTTAQLGWILGKWGSTSSSSQAAAVDVATYAIQGFSKYQLSASYGRMRADQAGVRSRAAAMIAEAKARAAA